MCLSNMLPGHLQTFLCNLCKSVFFHLHYSCCCVASCLLHVLKVLPARILGHDDDGVDDDGVDDDGGGADGDGGDDDGGGDDDDGGDGDEGSANNSHS